MAVSVTLSPNDFKPEEDMGGDMNGDGGVAVEGMDGGQMEGGDSPGGEGQMMNEEEFKQHQEEMYMQQQQRQMEYIQQMY